jgi:hypothetical protein
MAVILWPQKKKHCSYISFSKPLCGSVEMELEKLKISSRSSNGAPSSVKERYLGFL